MRFDYYLNWLKDGRKIIFELYCRGGWCIWIIDFDGFNVRRLDNIGRDYEFDFIFDVVGI